MEKIIKEEVVYLAGMNAIYKRMETSMENILWLNHEGKIISESYSKELEYKYQQIWKN